MKHLDFCHAETAPVRHHRYEAVQFAIQLEMAVLNNFAPVGLKAAVDIMQMDAGQFAHQPVEDTRGKGLRERIESLFFPTRNEIVSVIQRFHVTLDLNQSDPHIRYLSS